MEMKVRILIFSIDLSIINKNNMKFPWPSTRVVGRFIKIKNLYEHKNLLWKV